MTPVVSIICPAFNHEQFIRQTLDGLVMQQADFSFEIIVHDDASTDGTAAILREYEVSHPGLFNNIYQTENQFSKQSSSLALNMLGKALGKYVAMCEGDDYWTDPLKLQKQVDFLEANPDYSICWTRYMVLRDGRFETPVWESNIDLRTNRDVTINDLFTTYRTFALTSLYRMDRVNLKATAKMDWFRDNTLYSMLLQDDSKGAVLDFISAVYRIHGGGMHAGASEIRRSYTNYNNVREIITYFPACNNAHYRKALRESLVNVFTNMLESPTETRPMPLSTVYWKLLPLFGLRNKLYFTKLLLKHLLSSKKSGTGN